MEDEASVIESLGSPEKVAATIKHGLNDNEGQEGEFSETGYTDYTYDCGKEEHVHTFGNWTRYSSTLHSRICSGCALRETAPHYRMSATCTSDEYCRDCNTHEDNWEDAWGHDMVYEYDWAASEASGID